jgi:hypothetical protein
LRPASRLDTRTAALLQFELQCAGQRIGLGQPQPQDIALSIAGARLFAEQHLRLFVIAEALGAQGRDRHKPVAAQPGLTRIASLTDLTLPTLARIVAGEVLDLRRAG